MIDIHLREKLSPVGAGSVYREANTASEREGVLFYSFITRFSERRIAYRTYKKTCKFFHRLS